MKHYNRCFGCMEEKGEEQKCSKCGWVEDTLAASALHLPPGTILHGKYVLGRVLGQGGFGITYLAWDLNLNLKLAIKEYFPQELATRATGHSQVSIHSGTMYNQYEYGMEKFLQEARMLARFEGHPNIVSVRDYFQVNETAYLVMNYIEGVTLKELIATHGRKLPFAQALGIMMPVMDALKELHNVDVLHRDISPDNIYINKKGQVILIDFGAARQAISEQGRVFSVIIKPGYAPEEQYRSKGVQGPWTDIYSIAATIYHMITGQLPPESLDRMVEDSIVPPSVHGISIDSHQEKALLRAMSVRAEGRYKSVVDFQNDLANSNSNKNMVDQESKLCPHCDGVVVFDATRCKHCKSEITFITMDTKKSEPDFLSPYSIATDNRNNYKPQDIISIAISISAGAEHSLLMKSNGDLYSFGLGWNGRLGHWDIKSREKPERIKGISEVLAISAGGNHSLILLEDGSVYSFGANNKGQLGLGDYGDRSIPIKVELESPAKAVSAGNYYSLVLLESGEVCSFGYGGYGQLGHGDNKSSALPVKINGLKEVVTIEAGDSHSLILLESGLIYSFGLGTSGQLGHSELKNRNIPTLIEKLQPVKDISAGLAHSLAILDSGKVCSFGYGEHGRLGHGDTFDRLSPKAIENLSEAVAVSAGHTHSLVLRANGVVYSFGKGTNGCLGHGNKKTLKTPGKINSIENAKSVSAGADHSLLLLANGVVYSFGSGDYGRLGHGDSKDQQEPTLIHWM